MQSPRGYYVPVTDVPPSPPSFPAPTTSTITSRMHQRPYRSNVASSARRDFRHIPNSTYSQYMATHRESTSNTTTTECLLPSAPEATAVSAIPGPSGLLLGTSDLSRSLSLSQTSPPPLLTPEDMEYTLADLDTIYTDQDSVQMPPMETNHSNLDDDLQPAEILNNNLFDFGDIKEDMPDFQCNFLDNLDEDLDDPDSTSSGHLVIDQKMSTPQDTEAEGDPDPDSE